MPVKEADKKEECFYKTICCDEDEPYSCSVCERRSCLRCHCDCSKCSAIREENIDND